MKRFSHLLIPVALLLVTTAAFAGDGHYAGACTNDAQACVNKIAAKAASHGWMGVEGEVDEETGYFVITEVAEDGPAAKAGFKVGYEVTAVNGETVDFNDEMAAKETMAMLVPDAEVRFTVAAGHGKSKDIAVTLVSMPEAQVAKMLGKHMLAHVQAADSSSR